MVTRIALAGVLAAACAPASAPDVDLDRADMLAGAIETDRLMPWVTDLARGHLTDIPLSCEVFPPKDGLPACDLSNGAARTSIGRILGDLGYTVDRVDLPGDDLAVMLVAEWPGTTRSSEVVLVGAHYDAFYSGADDNSSGVAAMLAIAAAVRGHTFARTIRFVAFDLEERGSAGSTRYVEAGFAEHVVGALVLETIGFSSSSPNSQETTTGLPLPDVGDFLLVVANQRSAPIAERMLVLGPALADLHTVAVIAPSDGNFPLTSVLNRSDNAPFWAHGVPAVMLTDTAEFRNKAYHTEDDTVDRLDPAFLAATTRTTAATLAELAELQP